MNWLTFYRLMRTIYGRETPDVAAIEHMGLLAVKIGQTYALRPDFLPESHCQALGALLRFNEAVPPARARELLHAGASPELLDRLEHMDPEPLATASVGQVHAARLKGGDEVIIKMVKDDFAPVFKRDVASIRRLLRLVILLYPKLERVADPLGILAHIERSTLAELDMAGEIAGQDRLRRIQTENEARFDLSRMAFPHLYAELSSTRVLVAERIPGETFDALIEARRLEYDALLELFRLHGFCLFGVGTFHGDIHPGNVMLHRDRLFFLDTGAVDTVSLRLRRGLLDFFLAMGSDDFQESARMLNAMAVRGIEGGRYARFEQRFVELYRDFPDSTVSQVSLTRRMMETIKLGVHNGMVFERGMYAVIKSLMYLDGMVIRVNPDARLIRDMQPYIREFVAGLDAPARG